MALNAPRWQITNNGLYWQCLRSGHLEQEEDVDDEDNWEDCENNCEDSDHQVDDNDYDYKDCDHRGSDKDDAEELKSDKVCEDAAAAHKLPFIAQRTGLGQGALGRERTISAFCISGNFIWQFQGEQLFEPAAGQNYNLLKISKIR